MKPYILLLFLTFSSLPQTGFSKDSTSTVETKNTRTFTVPKLTPKAYASLLTIGPGNEIYQIFGHTAIRIVDSTYGWDLVYNYGAFDFAEPNFALKFVRGKLMYFLWVDEYSSIQQQYIDENRWIKEQKLELDPVRLQELFELLTMNAREEYKYYQYDFLQNNCSTKPRDIIIHVVGEGIKYQPNKDDNSTYRELIDRYVKNEWLDFGIDLLLGARVDRKAGFGRTFLPIELMELFDGATKGKSKLINGNETILDKVPDTISYSWLTPGLIFWGLFFIVLFLQLKRKTLQNWKVFPAIYFTLLGLIGWILVFMWFFTDHTATKMNLNILWAMPLNLPLAFFVFKDPIPAWFRVYLKAYRILLIVLLIGWWANPQQYHKAVIPLILTGIILTSRFLPIPTTKEFKSRWFG